jgi:opacity protein-like surface antigen
MAVKNRLLASAFLTTILSSAAVADDVASRPNPLSPQPVASWAGFYLGANVGTEFGSTIVRDPFGPSIYGDNVTTPGFTYGIQGGYNWQPPGANWVLGVEAEASGIDSVGNNTCFAYSGLRVPSNCTVKPSVAGALTARAGYAFGRSLVYAKGGLAILSESIDATVNGGQPGQTRANPSPLGWTLGGGIEYALTNAWSLRAEYDHSQFANVGLFAPQSIILVVPPPFLHGGGSVAGPPTSANIGINQFKFGLNYNFDSELPGSSRAPLITFNRSEWGLEFGGRDWLSSGRFQKGLIQPSLVSQLTYANLVANSGEIFARIDSPYNVFLKGFAGLGGIDGGHMNDEDFVLAASAAQPDLPTKKSPIAYSNTVSNANSGELHYATIDLGYDFATGQGYKLGAFAGYNIFHDQMKAYGCSQIANQLSDCATPVPVSTLGIVETDSWQSLRIGLNGDVALTDRFNLDLDVAYLPYVSFSGNDQHLLRVPPLFIPESGKGQGTQLETIVSYKLTDNWSLGAGGRYWAAWTNSGSYTQEGATNPAQYRTERYGVFLQASYKFGG